MNTTTHNKPLGFWLAAVEHRTRTAMRSAFADQGVSRRERRLLNTIAEAPVTLDELKAARESRKRGLNRHGRSENGMCANRTTMKGHRGWRNEQGERPARRSTSETLNALVEKGWLTNDAGTFAVTEEGTRVSASLSEQLDSVRSQRRAGISDADYATTLATLQAMAKNLSE